MIRIEQTEVVGWEAAIRGMRNPMNSWDKSDSRWVADEPGTNYPQLVYEVGPADLALMKKLVKAGSDHRKFMRFITVSVDITAPLYWWKEFDTYKVGTVANSCSTMHTLHKRDLTIDDFAHEHLTPCNINLLQLTINNINDARRAYVEAPDAGVAKEDWYQMIQLLPSSFLQKRTVEMNYEVLANMYYYRKYHKLDEWRIFCEWVENLPYSAILIRDEDDV